MFTRLLLDMSVGVEGNSLSEATFRPVFEKCPRPGGVGAQEAGGRDEGPGLSRDLPGRNRARYLKDTL